MFINEYVMNRKRYGKWATPKFWKYIALFLPQECLAGYTLKRWMLPHGGRLSGLS